MGQPKPVTCGWCGVQLDQSRRGRPKRFCCHAHRTRHHEWNRLRGHPVSLAAVAAQSGYCCGICSDPVDMAALGRLAPTIDHIIPTTRGGLHSIDNLQLAHLTCNTRKNARSGFTCLPLLTEGDPPLTLF